MLEGHSVGEPQLVETRRSRVQDAESVLAPLDLEVRRDAAVHEELVPEVAVHVHDIHHLKAGRVVASVHQQDRNVEAVLHTLAIGNAAGQAESIGVRVVLVAAIGVVEQQIEARESAIHILAGEVHAVVVVPER